MNKIIRYLSRTPLKPGIIAVAILLSLSTYITLSDKTVKSDAIKSIGETSKNFPNRDREQQDFLRKYKKGQNIIKVLKEALNSEDHFIRRSAVSLIYFDKNSVKDKDSLLYLAATIERDFLIENRSTQNLFNFHQNIYYLYRLKKKQSLKTIYGSLKNNEDLSFVNSYLTKI
jgi:hypothetical protein